MKVNTISKIQPKGKAILDIAKIIKEINDTAEGGVETTPFSYIIRKGIPLAAVVKPLTNYYGNRSIPSEYLYLMAYLNSVGTTVYVDGGIEDLLVFNPITPCYNRYRYDYTTLSNDIVATDLVMQRVKIPNTFGGTLKNYCKANNLNGFIPQNYML